jgi:hypothetical protein
MPSEASVIRPTHIKSDDGATNRHGGRNNSGDGHESRDAAGWNCGVASRQRAGICWRLGHPAKTGSLRLVEEALEGQLQAVTALVIEEVYAPVNPPPSRILLVPLGEFLAPGDSDGVRPPSSSKESSRPREGHMLEMSDVAHYGLYCSRLSSSSTLQSREIRVISRSTGRSALTRNVQQRY